MKNRIVYYLDKDGRLWRKQRSGHYYFSQKNFKWVKSSIFFILSSWQHISDKQARQKLGDLMNFGKYEYEQIPIRYFANDNDDVFAQDTLGNEFCVLVDMSLKSLKKGTVDIMWKNLSEKEAETLLRKLYEKGTWLMAGSGERLQRSIGDYTGKIWLDNYQSGLSKRETVYRSEISLDDGMDYPYVVAYFEEKTIEKLIEVTEMEMKKRCSLRENI